MSEFLEIDVEPSTAAPDGLTMRWKQSAPVREITHVDYESEQGLSGTWAVCAIDEERARSKARAALVEDSSDGEVLLIAGGKHGLLLEHPSGAEDEQPYLVLSRTTRHR